MNSILLAVVGAVSTLIDRAGLSPEALHISFLLHLFPLTSFDLLPQDDPKGEISQFPVLLNLSLSVLSSSCLCRVLTRQNRHFLVGSVSSQMLLCEKFLPSSQSIWENAVKSLTAEIIKDVLPQRDFRKSEVNIRI